MKAKPKLQKEFIWNGWTLNYRASEDGYLIHAFNELDPARYPDGHRRSLCGVRIQDSGLVQLGEDKWRPGCMKCCRTLRNAGLLNEKNEPS